LTVKKDNNVVLGSSFSRKYTEFATFLNWHERASEQDRDITTYSYGTHWND
jgi:hypothetical protein